MGAPDRETFLETLSRASRTIGVPLDDTQVAACAEYAALLISFNSHTNLTRITDPAQMAIKHFADSLTLFLACPDIALGARLADVGTGAGFPGLVLKIMRPDLQITLIDSLAKRIKFLASVVEALHLQDVALVHMRAEDAGRDRRHRDAYDIVVARAVAPLPILLEWCGPLVRPGGRFVAMKSSSADTEITSSTAAARLLECRLEHDFATALPGLESDVQEPAGRRLLVYRKLRVTPQAFPRTAASIKGHALGTKDLPLADVALPRHRSG